MKEGCLTSRRIRTVFLRKHEEGCKVATDFYEMSFSRLVSQRDEDTVVL